MKRHVWILASVLILSPAAAQEGFFFALDVPSEADRLYRIDWDGTVTPIGEPGTLGYPEVAKIVWDWDARRLYGYDDLLDVWLKIDPRTGAARQLGRFEAHPTDLTYCASDGMIYGVQHRLIIRIDPMTGEYEEALLQDAALSGLAHAQRTVGTLDGFFTATWDGLLLFEYANWNPVALGGNVGVRRTMLWNPDRHELYSFSGGISDPHLYLVNSVTGDEAMLREWDFAESPIRSVHSMTYVPAGSEPPACTMMDADGDGDIDLRDYADWQLCFTGG